MPNQQPHKPIKQHLQARYSKTAPNTDQITTATPLNQTIENLLTRASCREYTKAPINEDTIQLLYAAAFCAPSKSDLQQTTVIRIKDKTKQQRLANLNEKVSWIQHAPLLMVWCGDNRRIRKISDHKNHPYANDHLDSFMNAAIDAAITMSHFITAAESLGLGCCPVSELRDNITELSQELNLPKHVFPIAGLSVGWPKKENAVQMRLPLDLTVQEDTYQEPQDLLNQIDTYSTERETQQPTPPNQQRHHQHYGETKDYGWHENRTRQYTVPLRTDFGKYIKNQGFELD